MCSAHKVINQKLRSAKIMCGKELSIRGRVGESDLVFTQIWTVYKVVPVQQIKNSVSYVLIFFFRWLNIKSWCFEDALTWGTRADVMRCPGVSSCWRPRCGWCHRWPAPPLWSSTKLSDVQTSPSLPLSPPVLAPQSPCIPVSSQRAQSTDAVLFSYILNIHFLLLSLTSCMCSAIRHPPTFLSLEMKRKVLVLEGHLVSTCWKPRSLSTTSLISSTWGTNS